MVQRVVRTVEVAGRPVRVAIDHDPSPRRRWVILHGRLVDELTGQAPGVSPVVTTTTPGLQAFASADGVFGLTGVASAIVPMFVPPDPPAVVNIAVELTVRAPGYVPMTEQRNVALPVVATTELDNGFAPLALGDVALHREAVVIRGRTALAVGNTTEPVAATVTIRQPGLWFSLPSVANGDPAADPNIGSLHPPLARPRPANATLRRRPLDPAPVPLKTLLVAVPAGATELLLSDHVGLQAGHLLQIDEGDPDLIEWQEVATVTAASTAAQPARVQLTLPVAFGHRGGAPARRMERQPAGATKALTRDAIAGDVTVSLADLAGLGATEIVEISGGGHPLEIHRLRLYTAASAAAGYFRWPPLSRVAQLEIEADRGGGQQLLRRLIAPDYTAREHVVDLIF